MPGIVVVVVVVSLTARCKHKQDGGAGGKGGERERKETAESADKNVGETINQCQALAGKLYGTLFLAAINTVTFGRLSIQQKPKQKKQRRNPTTNNDNIANDTHIDAANGKEGQGEGEILRGEKDVSGSLAGAHGCELLFTGSWARKQRGGTSDGRSL